MRRSYHSNLAFLDLLFNSLLCFAALFVISFLLINPKQKSKTVEVKAEFLIVVEWPETLNDDVDVYVEDPAGNLVFFMRREEGLMHLDRDDLGESNDTLETPSGIVRYGENREIVTIRGTVPGEYVVNVHMYNRKTEQTVPVTVEITKINPFATVLLDTVELEWEGHEKTVCRFKVDSDGAVENLYYLPKSLVRLL